MNKKVTGIKNIKIRSALLILTLIFFIVTGCSNSSVTPREGTISGRILDLSGQPIEDALVSWYYDNTRWALTDSDGHFLIEGIGFGKQTFIIEAYGYRTSQFTAEIYSGQTTEGDSFQIEAKSFEYSDIEVSEVSATHATINWKTSDYTNGLIEYGESESMGRTIREKTGEYSTTHSLTISGLSPATQYMYKIVSSRENRDAETSEVSSFQTLSPLEDKSPPAPPANVEAALTSTPNIATVFWAPVSDTDLKGYKVYRAESANSAFSEISNTLIAKGQERYTDQSVIPGKKYYYKVKSIDQAGNESGFNNIANILVPGDISTEITWTKANSPYLIKGDINILKTGRLYIDSGVEVLISENDSFRRNDPDRIDFQISGALVASATAGNPVTFAANTVNPENNVWNGLKYLNVSNPANTLVNVQISDALVGLNIENSVGKFSDLNIVNCPTAIVCKNNTELTLKTIVTRRCSKGIEINGNTDFKLSDSTFYHPQICINSFDNDGITITGCNLLEFTDSGLISNETGSQIEINNNLFVAPNALAVKITSQNPQIRYNTFDCPYAIQITQGNPVIEKNIIIAERSVYSEGKKGIEHLVGTLPLPVFGPNNIFGFTEGNRYIGCEPSADSTNEDVLLMKDLNADTYDYRLRQPFPSSADPWGIQRKTVPFEP